MNEDAGPWWASDPTPDASGEPPVPAGGGDAPWWVTDKATENPSPPSQEKPLNDFTRGLPLETQGYVDRVRAALPEGADLDTAWDVVKNRGEMSAGQQFDKTGKPLASPKGALGVAQVMPSTGPEAAQLAGEQWDPERLANDQEYNDKLGKAYYAKQLKDFGDPVTAAAAYNAGPGRVRAALSGGEAPSGGFTVTLPGEKAPAPAAADTPAESTPADPDLSLGSALNQGIHNYPGSALDVLSNTAHAVMNPGETLGTLGKLGSGIVSQVAGGLGVSQDPAAKAQTEQVLSALEDHYKQTYGSWAGFKNALAKHPADVTMDLALPFTMETGALAGAGGIVGKVASLAGKVVTPVLNPIEGAVTMAKGLGSIAAPVIRGAQSVATGVPSAALKLATQAGATSDPLLKQAFTLAMKGQIDPVDLLQRTQSALSGIRDDASKAYMAGKAGLADAEPSFSGLNDALAKARSDVTLGSGANDAFARPNQALDEAQGMIESLRNDKGISSANIDQFDKLKKAIWDLRDQYSGSSVAQQHLGSLYAAAKQAVVDVDPKYAALMEQYQTGRNNITNIQKTLGAGPNAVANATLAKQLKALKTPQGQDLLTQIAGKDPTVPYMLAGSALQPWHRGGFADLLEVAMGAGLASFTHPVALGLPLVAGSPKLAGLANYGAGLAQRAGAAAATAPAEYGASVLGNPEERQQPPVARAAGGRTGVNHAARAATLVRAAETARRQQAQGTKVLLNQPDEAITRALAVADRSI